jgi:hypothetical protein
MTPIVIPKSVKKCGSGVRPLERQLENRADPEATLIRGYWSAARSALTNVERPP